MRGTRHECMLKLFYHLWNCKTIHLSLAVPWRFQLVCIAISGASFFGFFVVQGRLGQANGRFHTIYSGPDPQDHA